MTQIQLSVEEALDFGKADARYAGFIAGAQAMADHARRMKLDEIIAARAKQTVSDSTIEPKTEYNRSNEPQPADAAAEPVSSGNAGG